MYSQKRWQPPACVKPNLQFLRSSSSVLTVTLYNVTENNENQLFLSDGQTEVCILILKSARDPMIHVLKNSLPII